MIRSIPVQRLIQLVLLLDLLMICSAVRCCCLILLFMHADSSSSDSCSDSQTQLFASLCPHPVRATQTKLRLAKEIAAHFHVKPTRQRSRSRSPADASLKQIARKVEDCLQVPAVRSVVFTGTHKHERKRAARQLERQAEKRLRHQKQGKQRDQRSNQVFNAIEDFFA